MKLISVSKVAVGLLAVAVIGCPRHVAGKEASTDRPKTKRGLASTSNAQSPSKRAWNAARDELAALFTDPLDDVWSTALRKRSLSTADSDDNFRPVSIRSKDAWNPATAEVSALFMDPAEDELRPKSREKRTLFGRSGGKAGPSYGTAGSADDSNKVHRPRIADILKPIASGGRSALSAGKSYNAGAFHEGDTPDADSGGSKEHIEQAQEYGGEKAGAASGTASEAVDQAKKYSRGGAPEAAAYSENQAKNYAAEVISRAKEYAEEAVEAVSSAADQAKEVVSDKVGAAGDLAGDTASQANDYARGAASQAKGNIGDAASQAKDSASDAVSQAEESAVDAASQAKDTIFDAASQAKDFASDAASQAKNYIVDGTDQAKDSANNVASRMKDAAFGAASQGKDNIVDAASQAMDSASDAASQAKDYIVDGTDQAKDSANNAANRMKDAAFGTASQGKDNIVDAASQATDSAGDAASQMKDAAFDAAIQAKDYIVDGKNQAKDSASDAASQIKNATFDAASQAKDFTSDTVSQEKDFVVDAASQMKDAAIDATSQAKDFAVGAASQYRAAGNVVSSVTDDSDDTDAAYDEEEEDAELATANENDQDESHGGSDGNYQTDDVKKSGDKRLKHRLRRRSEPEAQHSQMSSDDPDLTEYWDMDASQTPVENFSTTDDAMFDSDIDEFEANDAGESTDTKSEDAQSTVGQTTEGVSDVAESPSGTPEAAYSAASATKAKLSVPEQTGVSSDGNSKFGGDSVSHIRKFLSRRSPIHLPDGEPETDDDHDDNLDDNQNGDEGETVLSSSTSSGGPIPPIGYFDHSVDGIPVGYGPDHPFGNLEGSTNDRPPLVVSAAPPEPAVFEVRRPSNAPAPALKKRSFSVDSPTAKTDGASEGETVPSALTSLGDSHPSDGNIDNLVDGNPIGDGPNRPINKAAGSPSGRPPLVVAAAPPEPAVFEVRRPSNAPTPALRKRSLQVDSSTVNADDASDPVSS